MGEKTRCAEENVTRGPGALKGELGKETWTSGKAQQQQRKGQL